MAFDQHIEADRIDDFNLFSAFVRVPLLILEGVLGQKYEKTGLIESRLDSNEHMDCDGESASPTTSPSRTNMVSNDPVSSTRRAELKKSESVLTNRTNSTSLSSGFSRSSISDQSSSSLPGLKRTTKMSWSDESGLSLVEYSDEQSLKHEPVSPYIYATSTTVPKKSALRRASSQPNVSEEDRTRYIPNMNKEKGLIMPTRPYGGKDASGVESPQWGWYASLTPPDMMYGSNKPKKQDVSGAPPMPQSAVTRIPEAPEPKTNQVFQNLKKSQQPVGWTSVPI